MFIRRCDIFSFFDPLKASFARSVCRVFSGACRLYKLGTESETFLVSVRFFRSYIIILPV